MTLRNTFRDWPLPSGAGVTIMAFQNSTGVSLTDFDMDEPIGITANEFLLIVVGNDSQNITSRDFNTPTDWNFIGEGYSQQAGCVVAAFWKKATGSEGVVNVSWNSNNTSGQSGTYMRLRGINTDDPVNNYNFAAAGAASTHAIPAIETTVKNCLAFYGLSFDGGDGLPFSVAGAGWSEQTEHQSEAGTGGASGCNGTKEVASIGTTGDATVTASVSDGAAFCQIALNPTGQNADYYIPGMMTFDGSTGYFAATQALAVSNLVTGVIRFNRASFSGGGVEYLTRLSVSGSGDKWVALVYANDHATVANRNKVIVQTQNSAGAAVCSLYSIEDVCDGADHTLFYSFDGDTGVATFYIDGIDADDVGHPNRNAPTIATLGSGAGNQAVGSNILGSSFFGGDIGFFGYNDAYLTNPLDFMTVNGPKVIDGSGWTEWGSQPLYWNQYGNMLVFNEGSAGNMTKNGTITGPS